MGFFIEVVIAGLMNGAENDLLPFFAALLIGQGAWYLLVWRRRRIIPLV